MPDFTIILDFILVLVSIIMLWKGAEWLVDSAAEIAHTLHVSDLVIGLTVVAFGTSAPEFAVTISAAFSGQSEISIGNVIGSNIFNLGFILGGTAVIRPISTSPKLFNRDGLYLLISTSIIFFMFFGLDGWTPNDAYSKTEGGFLFLMLIGYILYLFLKKEPVEETHPHSATWLSYIYFIVGLISIVAGGHLMVTHASNVARYLGVSDWIIAVTIVAAGTSAPELATSITAALKGRHGIALGNLIGSDLFNLLGVLGLAGIINPTMIEQEIYFSVFNLIMMVGLVLLMIRTNWRISRIEGGILVMINLIRWYFDFAS
ncbi:MAG: calcium/sodium antiporter [Candidatus Marinimicrobia bacterium]|jgi:cation:H+ antiporter|nr:calcium/sodium antiporter [Candidatus Neomarinimicrobiota bacterium]MDP6167176.1 calcium/sodium antiporter [Candidatus Neomarinimicrobiota bacterium]MDP6401741.1 calcium/sodium antiporter [Candidatus Neomarinimicrobiota bacterium]MDP6614250.1 calcium/sodium antiporter [Candidatus Neomarinimicrobiota bacterium]MDP6820276.1 calcium/sodium antiporter [Candidatus Neomarinimicrobiota bacterium]|tara:strand:- start:516 stop:1466 length:951 start_codon:yes stop_codon:yes gene_type:complete